MADKSKMDAKSKMAANVNKRQNEIVKYSYLVVFNHLACLLLINTCKTVIKNRNSSLENIFFYKCIKSKMAAIKLTYYIIDKIA